MSSHDVLDLIWLVPALPLFGALFLLLFGKRIGEPVAGWIGSLMLGLAFVVSVVMFFALRDLGAEHRQHVVDVGFMVAMFLIFAELGSLNYTGANGALAGALKLDSGTATAIALLLFFGAVGKSAQFPLHFWLPDAMEGPTPVSALIHAATMVTAGVFLVARTHAFFEVSGDAMTVVAWIGAS